MPKDPNHIGAAAGAGRIAAAPDFGPSGRLG